MPVIEDIGFVSTQQLAKMLGLSPWTIYGWRKRGVGPKCYRAEGKILYSLREVNQWLQEREAGAK